MLLVVTTAMIASCGFMLPVATPPNTIVFGPVYITILQIARSGFDLNLLDIVLTTILTYVCIIPGFDIVAGVLPDWVQAVPK